MALHLDFPEFDHQTFVVDDALEAFQNRGCVLLRGVVSPVDVAPIERLAHQFETEMTYRAARGDRGVEVRFFSEGHGNRPWECDVEGALFTAHLLHLHRRAFGWPLIEAICGSNRLTVPLNHMILRRHTDSGGRIARRNGEFLNLESCHQDANNVNPALPVTIWTALQDMERRSNAPGVGVIAGDVNEILPHPIDAGIFEDTRYAIWTPDYKAGDVMLFSNLAPHFSPVYGTGRTRFSIDFRACAADRLPTNLKSEAFLTVSRDTDSGDVTLSIGNMPGGPVGSRLADVLMDPQYLFPT
jgi:hypothetical protein